MERVSKLFVPDSFIRSNSVDSQCVLSSQSHTHTSRRTKTKEEHVVKTTQLETVVVIRSACLTFCRHK